ncbi:MAG: bifunctional phosphoribosyl-AMP cyclohydrolase/phosphoribosyl-ATP pyrophosphatase, partial [Actinobacteria bacterium]|nr:bifunctional phosphoribosyl-AMP cyclohydrolase/phosphoribosyl-ATP pyrophosphatase [Actinomycetota bacterium]NIS32544.1 bifunctional phosphoribosyl-AMP cyclohydrolase/phosphoribosyl-ATP pyrophosphatase [Actinomycetota bacterium]NIT96311.1 bifunctional phosphoribosyl-AMP cyclohydrolase/phosphoribosyl-ATP pyrophosphatase [Actinomycetota bacterium]NIU20029.1 bifunctional phosphoribosyl-AMP cyclohydrolase/phosphoribosyl-ATP pyrophosphatase [Actinomycetota bacterium]NIU67562.1 bifunctional phospho
MSAGPLPRFDDRGLVPVVVQDAATRRVLMLGYMDEEAYRLTREKGTVHFRSRSRDRLWEKGETSGNRLHVVDLRLDCDGDALLVL